MKPTPPSLSPHRPTTREAHLVFVHDTLQELVTIARAERCELLIYLLKMATDEALLESVRDIGGAHMSASADDPPPAAAP